MKNAPQLAKSNIGKPPQKLKKLCRPNMSIKRQWPSMLADCVQILIWVSISRVKAPQWPNLKVHFEIWPSGALSQDTLTQIEI